MKSFAEVSKYKFAELQTYIQSAQNYAKVYMKPHPVTINHNTGWNVWDGFNSSYVGKTGYISVNNGLPSTMECIINHLDSLKYLTNTGYALRCIEFDDGSKTLDDLSTYTPQYKHRAVVSKSGVWKATDIPYWVLIIPFTFSKPLFGDYAYYRPEHPYGAIVCEDIYGAPDFRTARLISFSQLIEIFNCKPIAKYTSEIKSLPSYKPLKEVPPKLLNGTSAIVKSVSNDDYGSRLASVTDVRSYLANYINNIVLPTYDGKFFAYALSTICSYSTNIGTQLFYPRLNLVFDFKGTKTAYGTVSIILLDTSADTHEVASDATLITLPISTKTDMLAILQFIDTRFVGDELSQHMSNDLLNLVIRLLWFAHLNYSYHIPDTFAWIREYMKLFDNVSVNYDKAFASIKNFVKTKTSFILRRPVVWGVYKFQDRVNTIDAMLKLYNACPYANADPSYKERIQTGAFNPVAPFIKFKIDNLQGYKYGCKLYLNILCDVAHNGIVCTFEAIIPDIFKPFATILVNGDKMTLKNTKLYSVEDYDKLKAAHSPLLDEPNPYITWLSQYGLEYLGSTIYLVIATICKQDFATYDTDVYKVISLNSSYDALLCLGNDLTFNRSIRKKGRG